MDLQNGRKRRKVNPGGAVNVDQQLDEDASSSNEQNVLDSSRKSISPPAIRRRLLSIDSPPHSKHDHVATVPSSSPSSTSSKKPASPSGRKMVPSPIQLSTVSELPVSSNVDSVSLKDILCDPLIKECWLFNYLVDVDFVMAQFDEDTRALIQVKVVHGSWKREDTNKLRIDEAANRYPNVQAITAYMAEAFGTHHSKMIILFRHDDQAQIVIVTANFIAQDWRMCQAVWRSPLLPMKTDSTAISGLPTLGTGARFKHDLLAYLRCYGKTKTASLVSQLREYDFSSIKAALVASVPSKINMHTTDPETEDLWGWPGLKRILKIIPSSSSKPRIVVQISSVASVGEKWLADTFFEALSTTKAQKSKPAFSVVFPTVDEIRRSLDGYSAGGSIHMKIQSTAQIKQLNYLRPLLCHWAGDRDNHVGSTTSSEVVREAGRKRAAPHIKTYIRFTDESMKKIDWAMMTSANLSTQAWGAATNPSGEVRICSYEIGIVIWPALWDEGTANGAEMVPVFKKDRPDSEVEESNQTTRVAESSLREVQGEEDVGAKPSTKTRVGWRMPYDLPLKPYAKDEMPWCATAACEEPDWMGRSWPGFGAG